MFILMGTYGVLSTVIAAAVLIGVGVEYIRDGYGEGKGQPLATGLSMIFGGIGVLVFIGMSIFGWFKDVPR